MVLAEPVPGEGAHNQRGLSAMAAYRGVVCAEIMDGPRNPIGAHELVQVSIDVIVNDAFDDICVEVVSQCAELLRGPQRSHRSLHISRRRGPHRHARFNGLTERGEARLAGDFAKVRRPAWARRCTRSNALSKATNSSGTDPGGCAPMPMSARAAPKSFDAAACGNRMSNRSASTNTGSFSARFSASRPTSVTCSTNGAVGVPPVTRYLTMSGR